MIRPSATAVRIDVVRTGCERILDAPPTSWARLCRATLESPVPSLP